jgi:hypothetical protein
MVRYFVAVIVAAAAVWAARPAGIAPTASYAKEFCAPLWVSRENPNAGLKKWGGASGGGHGRPGSDTKLWLVTGGRGGTPRSVGSADGAVMAFDNHLQRVRAEASAKRGSAVISVATANPGLYTLYYAEEGVAEGVRCTNSAKYELVYGRHGDKVELNRSNRTALPFEIVRLKGEEEGLFSRFFSGDTLTFRTMYAGRPQPGVTLTLTTDGGWSKRVVSDANGTASFTLIKEYFPEWHTFEKRHENRFVVTASWTRETSGELGDQPYDRHRYVTTYPGRFFPEPSSYKSYGYALLFGTAALLLTGIFVYIYRRRREKPFTEVRFDEKA